MALDYKPKGPYKVVGKNWWEIQGFDRLTGQASFCGDVRLPKMLFAVSVHSSIPKGKVLKVDATAAEAVPGVRLVMSYFNYPKTFSEPNVYFAGQEVAAVVAEDLETAEKAAALVKVEYEKSADFVLDLFASMKEGAPLVHPGTTSNIANHPAPFWSGKNAAGLWTKRTTGPVGGFGDVEQGFKECDVIVESGDLHYPMCKNMSPNGRGLVADWQENSQTTLTVYAKSKGHYDIRNPWAEYAGLPTSKVRAVSPFAGFMGGMAGSMDAAPPPTICEFGGRIAIDASKALGRPVKLTYNMWQEHLISWSKYSLARIKLGFKSDGKLHAMDHLEYVESGSYNASSVASCERCGGMLAYNRNCQHMKIRHDRVASNRLKQRDFNGIGTAPGNYHVEWTMDKAAEALKMDPIKLKQMNTMLKGSADGHWGTPLAYLDNPGHNEALDICAAEAGWANKWGGWDAPKTKTGEIRHGIGVAIKTHTGGAWAGSSMLIKLHPGGSLQLVAAMGDSGQNEPTSSCMQAAELLGIPYAKVSMARDSSDLPYVLNLGGSTGTWNTGWAVWGAAMDLREKVLNLATGLATFAGKTIDDLDMDGAGVFLKSDPTKKQTYTQVFARWPVAGAREICGYAYQRDPNGLAIPRESGASIWELDVDTETGKIFNMKTVTANSMGFMIYPKGCESQTDQGITQGGMSTFMDNFVDLPTGKNLAYNYIYNNVPTHMEFGTIGKGLAPFNKPGGVAHWLGSNPSSEGQPNPHLAAIANALYNATGVRFPHGPYTPDKVLAVLGKV